MQMGMFRFFSRLTFHIFGVHLFFFVFFVAQKNIGIELDLSYDLEVKVLLSTFGLTLN